MTDVVVVGSGPNGLSAALVLAAAGLEVEVHEAAADVGGGMRSQQLTLPGFWHDVCSAVHPMAVASPFFAAFDLQAHGVQLLQPEVPYAHPLDGGRAGIAWRDIDRTAAGLGADGAAWRALFGPLVQHWQPLIDTVMSDMRSIPRHPGSALRFAARMAEMASPLARSRLRTQLGRALLAGVSAHTITTPRAPAAVGAGLVLATLGHAVGWPLPRGGSRAIAQAMETALTRRGGRIVTSHRIDSLAQLPSSRAVLLDIAPRELIRIAGSDLPSGYRRQLRAFRHGGAVCKVDYALSGPVPWTAPECAEAGTLHLVGTEEEAVEAESAVASGKHAHRPYVLAVQPSVVDDTRAPRGKHVLWTYAHVPNGSNLDVSEAIVNQVERFAPGFRDLILAQHVTTATGEEARNSNYVGGDISGGATSLWQLVMRPVPRWDPYRTPIPGVYLCSASTPPGQAVHGMAGVHAAARVLRRQFGVRTNPLRLLRGLV